MAGNTVSIKGLSKAAVLAALYNASKPQGMGFMAYDAAPMTEADAASLLTGDRPYFDYLKGRVMKVEIAGDDLDTWGYDRDNGEGAAARAIAALRSTSDTNNVYARASHAAGTRERIAQAEAMLGQPEYLIDGSTVRMTGLPKAVKPALDRAREAVQSPLDVATREPAA